MRTLLQDLRFGFRMLWKRPGFTAVAALVLALGVGANTAIFSVVNAVLLRPLPYPGAERIVAFDGVNPSKGITESNLSAPDFEDWRSEDRAFEGLSVYWTANASLTGGDEPERVALGRVGGDFFRVMGVGAAAGRAVGPEDDKQGGADVAVIGHGLWRRHFGASPEVIGRRIEVSGRSYEVVGIMPPGFDFPQRAEIWAPARLDASKEPRDNRSYSVIGRLKEGVSLREAQAELDGLTARLAAAYPPTNAGWGVQLKTLKDNIVGPVRVMLLVLLGAVAFLLLVACANVANLTLARAAARRREVAVRLALGAGRWRVARQLMTESLLLSLLGGAAGVALSVWLVDLLVALAPEDTPRISEAGVDASVLLFALGAAGLTGALVGLAPALQATRPDVQAALKEGGRGAAGERGGLRSLLVVSEVAISVVLLVGAGLLVKSFARLGSVNPGFDPAGVMTIRVALPSARYKEPRQKAEFYEKLLERVRAVPGVESAGAVLSLPLGGSNFSVGRSFIREGRPETPEEATNAGYQVVSPGYFGAARVPLVAGRDFDERDGEGATMVVVVNETLARQSFPGEDPLGKRIKVWRDEKFTREVVGVVGDVKSQTLDAEAGPQIYVPHKQDAGWGGLSLAVRAKGDPQSLVPSLRAEVRALDSNLPVFDVKTLGQVVDASLAYRRATAVLMAAFACLAAALAAVGLYGVISYAVTQRTREIGIRVALGARPGDVLRLVLRQGGALVVAGVALGALLAFAATRAMQSLLYEVSSADPAVFILVPLLLGAVALVACLVPARRAARVDPMVALRHE
jgi:putative ABC transport system permease protein